jgi:hypothetical protein
VRKKNKALESVIVPSARSWVEYADGNDLPAKLSTELGRLRRQIRMLGASALGFAAVMGTGFGLLAEYGSNSISADFTIAVGSLGAVLLVGAARGTQDYAKMVEDPHNVSDFAERQQALGLPTVIHHREPGLPLRDQHTGGLASDILLEDVDEVIPLPSFAHKGFALPVALAAQYRLGLEVVPQRFSVRADHSALERSSY